MSQVFESKKEAAGANGTAAVVVSVQPVLSTSTSTPEPAAVSKSSSNEATRTTDAETTTATETATPNPSLPTNTTTTTTTNDISTPTLRETTHIAIIGGGIIGLITALGLLHRGIRVTVYERASKLTETSAGFSFSSGARQAMSHTSPRVREAFRKVAAPNPYPFIRYFDGFTPGVEEPLWQIPAERPDYHGCLRAAFLEALGAEVVSAGGEGVLRFGMNLEGFEEIPDQAEGEEGKVRLTFGDGSVVDVDAVIGCDGIKSRTRQLLLGEDDPAALPGFTHMVAYRAVIPLDAVVAAMGEDKGYSHCLHVGPGAYTVTYPIANNTLSNMILFSKTSTPWPDANKLLASCLRSTAQDAISSWKPDIRSLIDLLPETPSKWAMFDMSAHPAKSYTRGGRVCVAGDAAHASTPFLASGAAMGVEDAAVLSTVLETALAKPDTSKAGEKGAAISAAFRAFSALRLERSQMVVRYSREVGEMCMWQNEEVGRDPERCFQEIWRRYSDVWESDIGEMVEGARRECLALLEGEKSIS
ncbi:hypothetical protein HK57_00447 [Aspergillus ustus]|uniref:FAD-binding domain-containing protein n=1 Tax=Aspergillus ustus TaxID=40382 RepID=A0A0C1C3T8_ASPUT|nr:hypothetical protein HK57_00447 [Aspergillus ustus]